MLGPVMVFSSPTFLFAFLPVMMLANLATPAARRNGTLLAGSIVFYVWGAGAEVAVLLGVGLVSYTGGRWLVRRGRGWLAALVALLLVPIGVYKYLPNLTALAHAHWPGWALPLGISFFTFHAISYLVDVARGSVEPDRSLRNHLLYLFLFPHQIAGPIVRYAEIAAELRARREVTLGRLTYGCTRFAWGLAKKAFVADSAGVVADAAFAQPGTLTAGTAWLGAAAFAVQIYFDFSGYCDMAIGLAAVLGFRFPENFASPYAATGPADFWRRWHITLSRWFRDYVYVPLGGNRHGVRREYAALLATFALTSLWHGATWTFLLWGGLHSLALLGERAAGLRHVTGFVAARRALMVLFLVLTWVPFRAPTLHRAMQVWQAMVAGPFTGPSPPVLLTLTPWTVVALGIGALAVLARRDRTGFALAFERRTGFGYALAAVAAPALFAAAVVAITWLDFRPFLYFQF